MYEEINSQIYYVNLAENEIDEKYNTISTHLNSILWCLTG